MTDLVSHLRTAAEAAFRRAPFYRRLYGNPPNVRTLTDFSALPHVSWELLETIGIADLACLDEGQLIMELNAFSENEMNVPFTPLENEYDMDRRYHRMVNILGLAGANPEFTVVVCDDTTLYFAAEIERVLSWPIAVIFSATGIPSKLWCDLEKTRAQTVIWASPSPVTVLPKSCNALVTFNATQIVHTIAPSVTTVNVLTLKLVPWLAVSTDRKIYRASAGTAKDTDSLSGHFYLERGASGTLFLTELQAPDQAGAIPIVRVDTNIPVSEVVGSTFSLTAPLVQ